MKQKLDLRVAKTRRSIKEAFSSLILTKPVNRITVTELTERAEISKGTFYLHYLDIYDLYNKLVGEIADKIAMSFDPYPDLFTSPEAFVRTFLFAQVGLLAEPLTAAERAILSEKNIRFSDNYPTCFVDAFRRQIYKVGKLVPCMENDVKIEFLVTGMLSVVIKYPTLAGSPSQKEFVVRYLAAVIRETFPEFYR